MDLRLISSVSLDLRLDGAGLLCRCCSRFLCRKMLNTTSLSSRTLTLVDPLIAISSYFSLFLELQEQHI